jgi:hypothetical protein
MKKLRIEDLEVDSFFAVDERDEYGTVQAYSLTDEIECGTDGGVSDRFTCQYTCNPIMQACQTQGYTSVRTCNPTCDPRQCGAAAADLWTPV